MLQQLKFLFPDQMVEEAGLSKTPELLARFWSGRVVIDIKQTFWATLKPPLLRPFVLTLRVKRRREVTNICQ